MVALLDVNSTGNSIDKICVQELRDVVRKVMSCVVKHAVKDEHHGKPVEIQRVCSLLLRVSFESRVDRCNVKRSKSWNDFGKIRTSSHQISFTGMASDSFSRHCGFRSDQNGV